MAHKAETIDCRLVRRPDTVFEIREVVIRDVAVTIDEAEERAVVLELEGGDAFWLPANTPQQNVSEIKLHRHKPVIMLFDTETSQVHMLLLSQRVFMVFTPMLWQEEYGADESRVSRLPARMPRAPTIIKCDESPAKQISVRCAIITACDIDEDRQLQISDIDMASLQETYQNKTGRLLVPLNIGVQEEDLLTKNLFQEPVPVIYDQYGRLHYALLNKCIHLVFAPLWTHGVQFVSKMKITGITRSDGSDMLDTLTTPYRAGASLYMPRLPPEFYEQWQPNEEGGSYTVHYTSDDKVMLITRQHQYKEDEIVEEVGENDDGPTNKPETEINLSGWWDTRYEMPRQRPRIRVTKDEF